ncbi:MAG: hypothetical protein IJU12_05660 [Clostridia bacterium]|nr:hypothetical protein [Clostridia bacterium]
MKRTILLCAVLLLAALMAWNIQGFAETAAPVPQPEDFAGAYLCTTISFGKDVILPLEGEGPYILRIDGYEALIDGFPELGTEPLPLEYAEGELYFQPPEENERVFTLRLLEDGVVTLTFDRIPEAPVFRFDPVET